MKFVSQISRGSKYGLICSVIGLSSVSGRFLDSNQIYAQPRIPIRSVGPVERVGTDSLGPNVDIRPLSDGSILINDASNARIIKVDKDLKNSTVVQQFSKETTAFSLISYKGDSTLTVDYSSRSLLLLDDHGKIVRVLSLPHQQDTPLLASELLYGHASVDKNGRLIYRGTTPPLPPPPGSKYLFSVQRDSAPIVRVDLESRTVDTLARIRIQDPPKSVVIENSRGGLELTVTVNPLFKVDQWTTLSDGTIAVVRAQDYRIDFISPNGSVRSGARMPFDWTRLSDATKQSKVDSVQSELSSGPYATPRDVLIRTPMGPVAGKSRYAVAAAKDLPDYDSPLGLGSVKGDLDNHVWILPRSSNDAGASGLIYDIASSDGIVFDRVRIPSGRVVAGFGPGGALYLYHIEGVLRFLERVGLAKK